MGKCTEWAPRAVGCLLHIMTFGAFVDVGMKLLLGSGVTHWTIVSFITLGDGSVSNVTIRVNQMLPFVGLASLPRPF
jgi:hypothetical protein